LPNPPSFCKSWQVRPSLTPRSKPCAARRWSLQASGRQIDAPLRRCRTALPNTQPNLQSLAEIRLLAANTKYLQHKQNTGYRRHNLRKHLHNLRKTRTKLVTQNTYKTDHTQQSSGGQKQPFTRRTTKPLTLTPTEKTRPPTTSHFGKLATYSLQDAPCQKYRLGASLRG
jgi:hypothetical protein